MSESQDRTDAIKRVEDRIIAIERRARRERIATAALAGMCAATTFDGVAWRDIAEGAVAAADALLAELDKDEP